MRRRDFLKLAAASGAGAVVFTGCQWGDGDPEREFQIQSTVLNPSDLPYGRDVHFATVYPGNGVGSGLLVRVFEGRAKKIEGNPEYPLNVGRTTAIEQALVQEVYHPDRITSPMRLRGERGSGDYEPISWDAAISEVAGLVRNAGGAADSIVVLTEPISGSLRRVVDAFVGAVGGRHVTYEDDEKIVLREAMRRTFGSDQLPTIDLANTRFLLNFGAEFLHHWISPVQFNVGYGEFRGRTTGGRGLYWHVGPQLSATASSADRWYPILPGSEGLVALSIAQVMAQQGTVDSGRVSQVFGGVSLDQFAPDRVAQASGLTAEQITELATRFGQEGPNVAIAGTSAAAHTNGLFNLVAVFSLNYLVGSVNVPGGVMLNPPPPANVPGLSAGTAYRDWAPIISNLSNGTTRLLLLHGANPAYGLPEVSGIRQALGSVERIVSFSSFVDETSAHADLILPDHATLENWGLHVPDPGPGYPLVGLQQPVVLPYFDSRSFGDSLIQLASGAGATLPWSDYASAVQETATSLSGAGGNITADDPAEYFVALQSQGGWWDPDGQVTTAPSTPSQPVAPADPAFAGDEAEFPIYLVPYPHNSLAYGEYANLPWLQALPEPMTTVVWTTWVELNPETAQRLDVTTEDVVEIESPNGSFELPVYVNPAAAPDVALIPMGQGHEFYTRYAEDRGENPLRILAPQLETETGALAWAATRVRISKADRKVRLPRFEGYVAPYQLEEFPIIRVARPHSE